MKYLKVIYWNIAAIFKHQPKQLHLIKIKVKGTQQTNVTLQTSAWNRCYVRWLSIRYSKHKCVQQAFLSESSWGKQRRDVPEDFLTFSVFKIILHTVLFFLSLTYFSDLFFFLEEKKYSARSSHWRAREMQNCGGRGLVFNVLFHLFTLKAQKVFLSQALG